MPTPFAKGRFADAYPLEPSAQFCFREQASAQSPCGALLLGTTGSCRVQRRRDFCFARAQASVSPVHGRTPEPRPSRSSGRQQNECSLAVAKRQPWARVILSVMAEESTTHDLVELTRRVYEAVNRREFDSLV